MATQLKLPKQLSKNLSVEGIETTSYDDDFGVDDVLFICTFFGEQMTAEISKKHVEKNFAFVLCSGPGELFDSFESQVENEYWEQLKEMYLLHEQEEIQNL